jgi:hypothetical protein
MDPVEEHEYDNTDEAGDIDWIEDGNLEGDNVVVSNSILETPFKFSLFLSLKSSLLHLLSNWEMA